MIKKKRRNAQDVPYSCFGAAFRFSIVNMLSQRSINIIFQIRLSFQNSVIFDKK